jgi:hypothetical protein
MDKGPFITNLSDEIKISVLLIETKNLVEFGHFGNILWGYKWVAGRFSNCHKRYIREEDNK